MSTQPLHPSVETPCSMAFGQFRANLRTGELWKADHRVRLQGQPFKVLVALLEHPGEIVSREELQQRIWEANVVVDFEHSLGNAIKKIRDAIGDSAENPRFIETIPKRGYRFIAPVAASSSEKRPEEAVEEAELPSLTQDQHNASVIRVTSPNLPARPRSRALFVVVCGIALLSLAADLYELLATHSVKEPTMITGVTHGNRSYPQGVRSYESFPATVVDGERLFTTYIEDGHVILADVSASTGEAQKLPVPSEVSGPEIDDISPDGSKLLVRSQSAVGLDQSEQPLWVVPTNGGSAFRVPSVLAHAAAWMPDGKGILYTTGTELLIAPEVGGASRHFASVPGRAFWLRWSPDGKSLRFTILDIKNHASSLWEIATAQGTAHAMLAGWTAASNVCCGTWTADRKLFVFQATHDRRTDLWQMDGAFSSQPVRVTNGPLNYEGAAADRRGERIFFVGRDPLADWQQTQYDPKRHMLVPRTDFLSEAGRISFSRDHQWIAWTDPSGHLWRARGDGSEMLQLTQSSLYVLNAAWSPDGTYLALMAYAPGLSWDLYRVSASGGASERLLRQVDRGVGDPSFSPDGKFLVFGGVPYLMGAVSARPLEILDLGSDHVAAVPHSEGLYSPRWSPDGRYIAALTLDQHKLMLYELASGAWRTLVDGLVSDPTWAPDSTSIYINRYGMGKSSIDRVSTRNAHTEEIANPACGPAAVRCFLSGVTPDNVLLILVEGARGNLYTMDFSKH